MSKFLVVKEAPTELKKGEFVIDKPNFLAEIALHKSKAPRNGLTGLYHIRTIIDSIAQNYDPENMTAYSVKAHHYEGRPFANDQELNSIVVEMLRADCPKVFTKYLDKKIKSRPKNTDLVYVVRADIPQMYETLYQNGLSELVEEKVKEKSTRVVGKPAVKGNTFKVDDKGNSRPATDAEVDAINAMEIVSESTHTTKF